MGGRLRAAGLALVTVGVVGLSQVAADAQVIKGTGGKDNLHGTPKADVIYGYGGNDTLAGRRGEDRLYGGSGQDSMGDFDQSPDRYYGGPDKDFINTYKGDKAFGGPGGDVFNTASVTKGTFVDCGPGNDVLYFLEQGNKPRTKGCEHVEYAPAGRPQAARARVIKGTPKRDKLNGTPQDDVIYGYGGNDDLDGRKGTDRLYGGADHDFVRTSGGDRAFGGPGKDIFNAFGVNKATYVDCGPGEDFVYYDNKRPRTKGCEGVFPLGAG